MKNPQSTQNEFPDEILENLCKTANPNKTEITESDKIWAATMLEMDLQSQNGAIWETQNEEDSLTEHNRRMMKKMI